MTVNVSGLVTIIIFYVIIFAIGIWAAWKRRLQPKNSDEVMLAGRKMGCFVGLLTLTATWVGGGYINGSAEMMYTSGLLWCQAPFGYAISLSLSGFFFARKMRDAGYVTMLDPLQEVFGNRWGSFLFFIALSGEMLWTAAILAALGTTLAVILNLNATLSIVVSAAIAVTYTLFGGLAAVAYTDVVQLFCIFIGLWLTVPFAITNSAVSLLSLNATDWLGSPPVKTSEWGEWLDYYILIIFGGIPWQAYFQRVLAARTSRQAQVLSYAASIGCVILVIPACLIGVIAKATDWEATSRNQTISTSESPMVLPLVMHHLTPNWVSFMGLGAVSAAVMSSADSCVLSSASMFTRNLYVNVFKPKASDKEQIIVMRVATIVVATLACAIAIEVKSVYALFHLCSDLVYVMLFPQLTLAVHFPSSVNMYGSVAAFWSGFILRTLGGEKFLNIWAIIKFPWYDYDNNRQLFPFRTFSMLLTFIVLLLVSWASKAFLKKSGIQRSESIHTVCLKSSPKEQGLDNAGMKNYEEEVETGPL